jgi:tripartite-type tricarboxylate transporter receptor subunit TctC
MSRTLGQSVLIDPRAGGGTMVASLFVKSQSPDGYTMYAASNSVTIKSVIPNAQIDIRKDFTPIIAPSISPMLILVNAEQVKATTIRELLAEARAKGGEMNYASYGIGSGAHMFMEMLLNENKVKMVHVPYQGTAQAAADTAGGRVQVTGTILASARPYLAEYGGSGKLRLIGQSLGERTPLLPNTPGMKESGFPDLDYGLWGGYLGPAGMSREVVATLNRAVNAALKDPAIVAHWTRLGQQIIGGTPEDLTRIINREYDGYTRLIRETGVKLE